MCRFNKYLLFFMITISGMIIGPSSTCFSNETAGQISQNKTAWDYYESGQYFEAHRIWQEKADQGDDFAQINLGALYDNGLGVSQNSEIAAKWYRLAAEKGNPYGQYNLGCMYVQGRGVPKDLTQAENWYIKATKQDLPMAQYSLGMLYAEKASKHSKHNKDSIDIREIAVEWLYKSGISYLKNREIENARTSLKAIEEISSVHSLKHRLTTEIQQYASIPDTKSHLSQGVSIGTAWPISQGYVITNNHVVAGSDKVVLVDASGQEIKAWAIIRDEISDIAILQVGDIDKLPPALPISDDRTDLGAEVFTIGFPRIDVMGDSPKCTQGTINRLAGINDDPHVYQTTVPIQPGNSGGPLLNMKGEVVGIIRSQIGVRSEDQSKIDVMENASCAIKIENLKSLFTHVPQRKALLITLPAGQERIEKLFSRIQDSLLIVVAQ